MPASGFPPHKRPGRPRCPEALQDGRRGGSWPSPAVPKHKAGGKRGAALHQGTRAKTQPNPWVLSRPLIVSSESPISPEHPAAPGASGVRGPAAASSSTFRRWPPRTHPPPGWVPTSAISAPRCFPVRTNLLGLQQHFLIFPWPQPHWLNEEHTVAWMASKTDCSAPRGAEGIRKRP